MKEIHKKNYLRQYKLEKLGRSKYPMPSWMKAQALKLFEENYRLKQAMFDDIIFYMQIMDGDIEAPQEIPGFDKDMTRLTG